MSAILEVRDLQTRFDTLDGVVCAVDGVSFDVARGETLGIVGESGSGKSITAMSIMRLVPNPPGRIVSGEILFNGRDLLKASEAEIRGIRGNRIAMIFQDPMTSLNPVLTVGRQITESLILHKKMTRSVIDDVPGLGPGRRRDRTRRRGAGCSAWTCSSRCRSSWRSSSDCSRATSSTSRTRRCTSTTRS